MINWIHRFLNPHCEHCADELREKKICESCEVLKTQLEIANQQIRILQEAWINKDRVIPTNQTIPDNLKPMKPQRHVPWRVKQQELEREDRHKLELLQKKSTELKEDKPTHVVTEVNVEEKSIKIVPIVEQSSVEELERELGVVNDNA